MMNREEIIDWLIGRSHPNPNHAKYVNRSLFITDNLREIATLMDFQEMILAKGESE